MISSQHQEKLLIIRLSSFGDILQGLSVPTVFKKKFPKAKVDWVVRSDFAQLIENHPNIDTVWSFEKKNGLLGWIRLALQLRKEGYSHVYDAHSNVRSRILCSIFQILLILKPYRFARRSKERWKRFLLFKFGKNHFPKPYLSQFSFLRPLKNWGIEANIPEEAQLVFDSATQEKVQSLLPDKEFIALAPSAAWQMKRWPIDYWKQLIEMRPNDYFVILGGPCDSFCEDIAAIAPERTLNLAGKLRLIESCAVLEFAKTVVSGDTGLLHASDALGRPTVALIGPTAFGYPSHKNSVILDRQLDCQPCSKDGRGNCSQVIYQKCMVEIEPQMVSENLN